MSKICLAEEQNKIPIIYTDKYNITIFGFQKLHPFDSEKYNKAYKYLKKQLGLDEGKIYKPPYVNNAALEKVHSLDYLKSLNKSKNVARIAEMPILSYFPNFILQKKMLDPMKYAVGGTVLGSELAFKYGWAINLSGGYHHAKNNKGEGFCFFSDIAMAINHLWNKNSHYKILIIDLDAHQGNGVEDIFKDDPLGQLGISENGIIQRDEIVFRAILSKKIPIEMVLSGGYTGQSGLIIGKSINNLLTKVIGINKK